MGYLPSPSFNNADLSQYGSPVPYVLGALKFPFGTCN